MPRRYYLITMKDPNNPPTTDPYGEVISLDQPGHHIHVCISQHNEGEPSIDHHYWTMCGYESYEELSNAAKIILETLPSNRYE